MSKLNVDLMLAVRDQITMHPETHKQHSWGDKHPCGTTHCIAGWAAALSGADLTWTSSGALAAVGDSHHVQVYAENVLGLDVHEASDLFFEFSENRALAKLDALIEKGKNQP